MIVLNVLLTALLVVVLYILFLWACACFVDESKEYDTDSAFYRSVLYGATTIGVALSRIKIEVNGIEKLPKGQKLLFVCNHRSKFDPIVTWHIFREYQLGFISKPENFNVFIFGKIIRRCCFLAIDRENSLKAIRTINKAAKHIKNGNASIGVYPEGKRNFDDGLLPFHNGVLLIAKKAKCPVAVLALSGTEQIHKNAPFRKSGVRLTVCEVIPAETVCENTSDYLGNYCREIMEKELNAEKGRNKDENDLCAV